MPRRVLALALALALPPACSLNPNSKGGKPTLGDTGGTAGDASMGDADDTGDPVQGPRQRRLTLATEFVGDPGSTLLVVLDPSRIEYDNTQPDGSDLRFFGPDETSPYPIEIERWEPGGTSIVWVRVAEPSLPGHLWMTYGDGESFAAFDSADVWDGAFSGVWHMAAQGTAFPDSSGSGNPLIAVDYVGQLEVEGAIGSGAEIGASTSDKGPLEVSDVGEIVLGETFTLEAWVSRPQLGDSREFIMLAEGSVELRARDATMTTSSFTVRTVGEGAPRVETQAILGETWSYVVATYRASEGTLTLYHNANSHNQIVMSGTAESRAPLPATDVLRIGVDLIGSIDEVRVSGIARSPGWVALQYASMSDELFTFGPAVDR